MTTTAEQIVADFDEDRDDIRDMCEAESPVSSFNVGICDVYIFDDGSSVEIYACEVKAVKP